MSKFGDRLRSLRIAKSMTQQELADRLKLNKQTISQYERGIRQPQIETLEILADIFNVDMNYLLGKEDLITRLINSEEYSLIENHRNSVASDSAEESAPMSPDQKELNRIYESLNTYGKKELLKQAIIYERSGMYSEENQSDSESSFTEKDEEDSQDGIA